MIENVSRETLAALVGFRDLVLKWSPKINLVAKSTLDDVWQRHIQDSAQLYAHAGTFSHWADLGSGGGFPGIVIAILAKELQPNAKITLVESDQRKSVFLRTASRELKLQVQVQAERIERIDPLGADVLSARALCDLSGLLGHAERHLAPTGQALFMKGARWQQEHEAAQKQWHYQLESITSSTDPNAAILKIKDIARA